MFIPDDKRYDKMIYNRCGKSGLKLSALSLGFIMSPLSRHK